MRLHRLPLTYDECRARFRRSAHDAGLAVQAHPITARGPEGQRLEIDTVVAGASDPGRGLIVMAGVHGVEGFIGSALECKLLGRLSGRVPDDVAVLVIHAVNPWGMAWNRRQNESNVDLNRNWRRSDVEPVHNDAYDEIHHLACPDTPTLPSTDDLLAGAMAFVEERGLAWVRDAITTGQYRHPGGLHYGGARTEQSTAIVEHLVAGSLSGVEQLLALDLHTGHGPRGEVTFLSDAAPGTPQDEFLHADFGAWRIEATAEKPAATTGLKAGQIANGFRDLFPEAERFASSVEFGTASDFDQLTATYQESWVHRHGDRSCPEHAAVVRAYRECFTPDDPEWEATAMTQGRDLFDVALGIWSGEPRA